MLHQNIDNDNSDNETIEDLVTTQEDSRDSNNKSQRECQKVSYAKNKLCNFLTNEAQTGFIFFCESREQDKTQTVGGFLHYHKTWLEQPSHQQPIQSTLKNHFWGRICPKKLLNRQPTSFSRCPGKHVHHS